MRSFLALTLFAAACTNASGGQDSYDSVRDRLAAGPTRLFVGSAGSTGSITARRWTPNGWLVGATTVTIANGEVSAKVDDSGALVLDHFEVNLAPIDIPEDVFKKPAQLDDVRLSLQKPASADMAWTSKDDATAAVMLDLDFDWTIRINGGKTPLGTQHLPPVTVDLMVTGGGDHVDASVSMKASGELWNWAGLLQMIELDLSLSAATVDE